MKNSEELHDQYDPVGLAAELRGAAIELLHGRDLESERLALLLEVAAAALFAQGGQRRETSSSTAAERLAQIKERHHRAYERWTSEDDASLREQYAEGCLAAELAETFQRQPSAIRSRPRRLGLVP